MDNKSLIRDIKLGQTTGDYQITIETKHLPNKWFYFWNKKRKLILELFERGAVLTGSRALDCYYINGKKIFNREPEDFDFIMTKGQFLEFCKSHYHYPKDLSKAQYHLNKSLATFTDDYGDGKSYWFKCLIQIIIKDELPEFEVKDGKRFHSIHSILESKIDLLPQNFSYPHRDFKHQTDLNMIYINIQ